MHIHKYEEDAYGCFFCKTGAEYRVANAIEEAYPEVNTLVPRKLMHIRLHGELQEKEIVMFPGYVCFRAPKDFDAQLISREEKVYRVLLDNVGGWMLNAHDADIVQHFFRYNGLIGISDVYYEGKHIKPVSGLLKDLEGYIVRVDRRKAKAQVCFELYGRMITTWLAFDEILASERV